MKRRWAWNIFCALSLLLFVASVTLWVRSYVVFDAIIHSGEWPENGERNAGGYTWWTFAAVRGRVGFSRMKFVDPPPAGMQLHWEYHKFPYSDDIDVSGVRGARLIVQFGGFTLAEIPTLHVMWCQQVIVLPLWLFLPAGIPPFLWWRKWKKARRGRGFPVQSPSPSSPPAAAKNI